MGERSIVLSGECSLIVFCFILCLFTHCALLGMTENPKPCSARGAAGTYEVLVVKKCSTAFIMTTPLFLNISMLMYMRLYVIFTYSNG